jgi:hypothetical protein
MDFKFKINLIHWTIIILDKFYFNSNFFILSEIYLNILINSKKNIPKEKVLICRNNF